MTIYSTLPPKIRQQVLERDDYTCQRCKTLEDVRLDVHHIIPVRKGGHHDLSNLITYCAKCHKRVEPSRLLGYPERVGTYKCVKVSESTQRRLAKIGVFGESFDDVINRLIEYYEKGNKK